MLKFKNPNSMQIVMLNAVLYELLTCISKIIIKIKLMTLSLWLPLNLAYKDMGLHIFPRSMRGLVGGCIAYL